MRRWFVAVLAATVFALGVTAQTGSSSGSSSSGNDGSSSSGSSGDGSSGSSSSDGSSGGSNGSSGSSNSDGSSGSSGSSNSDDSGNNNGSGGQTNNGNNSSDGTSNGGSSSGGSGGSGGDGGNGNGDGTTDIPGTTVTLPPVPGGFTLPRPAQNEEEVEVPEGPPKELEGKSAKERLSSLPPVPRSCLDSDLSLLDVFVPGAAIPLRLTYCLLYVGTIARFPGEIDGGGSSSRSVDPAPTQTTDGDTVRVPLVQPRRTQRPLATIALLFLIVAVAVTIGFVVGQRRGERAARIDGRASGE